MINEEGEVIVIELKEEYEETSLECNSLGIFRMTEMAKLLKPPTPMRLEGKVKGIEVQVLAVLADNGATNCFINSKVAVVLSLVVEPNVELGVKLGDGHKVTTVARCRNVEVQLGNFTTKVIAYMLELGDLGLILGTAWMRQFGKITFVWENMVLSFPCEGNMVELQGLKTSPVTPSLHSLLQDEEVENKFGHKSELTLKQQEELDQLLKYFSTMFTELEGLAPTIDTAHGIELHKETTSMSV